MPTNRDQAVVEVLEEFREMVRASARKSGDEIVTMTLRDLRALVEPPSTPTDAELEAIAKRLASAPDDAWYIVGQYRAILAALKSVRDSSSGGWKACAMAEAEKVAGKQALIEHLEQKLAQP